MRPGQQRGHDQSAVRRDQRPQGGIHEDGSEQPLRAGQGASKYYLNHIWDAYRQATIDVLIGKEMGEELLKLEFDKVDININNAKHVKTVIIDSYMLNVVFMFLEFKHFSIFQI